MGSKKTDAAQHSQEQNKIFYVWFQDDGKAPNFMAFSLKSLDRKGHNLHFLKWSEDSGMHSFTVTSYFGNLHN